MIEAICWDVGGVFSARPVDAISRVALEHGIDPDKLLTVVFGSYDTDGDHVWHRLERGELPLADAWEQIEAAVGRLGLDLSLADFFRSFGSEDSDRSMVAETLLDLHADGVRMAIVTNNVREFSEMKGGGWRAIVPIEAFDVVVDSSAVGLRKPDRAIYECVLGELGVVAEATVFVDDTPANVDAARAVGMHGVLFGADPVAALAELRAVVGAAGGTPLSSR